MPGSGSGQSATPSVACAAAVLSRAHSHCATRSKMQPRGDLGAPHCPILGADLVEVCAELVTQPCGLAQPLRLPPSLEHVDKRGRDLSAARVRGTQLAAGRAHACKQRLALRHGGARAVGEQAAHERPRRCVRWVGRNVPEREIQLAERRRAAVGEGASLREHETALVPRRVVVRVVIEQQSRECELVGPQVECLEHPLPVAPRVVVLCVVLEALGDEDQLGVGSGPPSFDAAAAVEPHLVILRVCTRDVSAPLELALPQLV
mmetsp:Transcript_8691/g.22492  ORF Transcript_8691/g.22492 Transcript_8691/m.22492 type:complete len:262 (-) Transcript_8691:365-1150(-)